MDDRDDDLKILLSALKDGGMYVGEEEEEKEEEEEDEEEDEEDDEDEDVHDDNVKTDLACPFCSEDFDMLGLCCHIDSEHRIEAKTGPAKRSPTRQPCTSAEPSLSKNSLDGHISESSQAFLSMDKDQEEKVQRSEFVKGLLFSTILEDWL
ncbi:hypothetical protein R3W88_025292 [Solanum pinnatisectum]|uniref:Uncharacterized protein n=1 Tax=Solanum pinnatisectum TaxID=50273 RepID=A0AAV9M611_9SOLN|nr:hypothetical protein R3W88_025292 [Solanum pinnatisectum]